MINYVTGDATQPIVRPAIIAHVCNDQGGWGKGFVLAVSKRWPEPEAAYRAGGPQALGSLQVVPVELGVWVANMVAQRGYRSSANLEPLRYDVLEVCLVGVTVAASALGASVHMPRIGTGLAGGSWNHVHALIERNLVAREVPVYVYDLP